MHAICESCSNAPLLKELVRRSSKIGRCNVCLKFEAKVLKTSDPVFILAIKALIRYYYSEWDYHGRLGGESFQTLLSVDNPILRVNPKLDPFKFEEFLLSFLDKIGNDKKITLFTAYGRAIYLYRAMRAVSEGESALIEAVSDALKQRNHFLVEAEFLDRFKEIEESVTIIVAQGTEWYRARIGAERRAADAVYSPNKNSFYYEPYSDIALGAPPVGTTSAGRLNRPGVSYLYVASNVETAIAEVRPHPGEFISIGAFSITADQRVADLSNHRIEDLFRNDKQLEILETIIAIENAFATAAPPSDRQVYSLTQFLAETFRRLGFDGVKFRSTVASGANLVLFDPAASAWVPKSSRVVEVSRVLYKHENRNLHDPDEIYEVDLTPRASTSR
jgi:hypothetical protein